MRMRLDIPEDFEIQLLASEGTGLGVGSISRANRLKSGDLTREDSARTHEAVNDPSFYVPVEFGDDGCGDGRGTVYMYRVKKAATSDGAVKEVFERSGHRSKIFGGGLNIGWAMQRVLWGVPKRGETLNDDRSRVADELDQMGIDYGGHTGSHAYGVKIGCGAFDEAIPIIGYVVEYANDLYKLTKQLKGSHFNEDAFSKVVEVFTEVDKNHKYTEGATGRAALQILDQHEAVIKELNGEHNEVLYLRNHIPGTTFNQARLNRDTNDKAQAFVDDVWRRDMYAYALGAGKDELVSLADIAGEVITLATTIALTDGSQEVYQRVAQAA